MSPHHRHMVEFFARQGVDALSPSNWGPTNPTVLRSGLDSMGQTWLKGTQRYLTDVLEVQAHQMLGRHEPSGLSDGRLKPLPFEVGKDVAVTPGKVVFRNRLIELIRYTPATAKVHPEPLLIVSEPGHPGRSCQMASAEEGHGWIDPDAWVAQAPLHEGSWWPAMSDWLKARSSAPRSPPALQRSQVLGDAPGTYVKVRYAD